MPRSDPPLSVVIPTLNAAAGLPGCLAALDAEAFGPIGEIVVVDGGSQDGTLSLAALRDRQDVRLLSHAPGRGGQLAAGAEAARGTWLLFLHADTRLAAGWAAAAREVMAGEGARAAVFRFALDDPDPRARRIERLARWRGRVLGLPYGDQGLLISRDLYDRVGGYRNLPLMEDVDLVRRLGRRRLHELPVVALTSAARYRRGGWWLRPARNLCLLALYYLGLPSGLLRRLYG